MTHENIGNVLNAAGSLTTGIIASSSVSWGMQVLGWGFHLIASIAVALICAWAVYHYNRYLKRKNENKK